MCKAYLKHYGDKQTVCVQVAEKLKRETMCWRERERNLKTKGVVLESHCMYSYGSGTRVNLSHMCERHYYTLRHYWLWVGGIKGVGVLDIESVCVSV